MALLEPFRLGNINKDSVEEMVTMSALKYLEAERMQLPQGCSNCNYFNVCHGGCIRQAYYRRKRVSDRDYYCLGYRKLYEHIHRFLLQELGSVPVNLGETRNFETIESPVLRKVIQTRLCSSSQHPSLWWDKTWMQWRNEWAGKWDKQWQDFTDFND